MLLKTILFDSPWRDGDHRREHGGPGCTATVLQLWQRHRDTLQQPFIGYRHRTAQRQHRRIHDSVGSRDIGLDLINDMYKVEYVCSYLRGHPELIIIKSVRRVPFIYPLPKEYFEHVDFETHLNAPENIFKKGTAALDSLPLGPLLSG